LSAAAAAAAAAAADTRGCPYCDNSLAPVIFPLTEIGIRSKIILFR